MSDEKIKLLKQQIVQLHEEIAKIYSGKSPANQNIIQLIHKLTHLNTEYKRLKSQTKS